MDSRAVRGFARGFVKKSDEKSGAADLGGTSMGGAAGGFPSTIWSRILEGAGDGALRPLLETLARRYWKPVYWYVRTRWHKGNEEAKDLTQDFFAWMLDGGLVAHADPRRGRFRAYLKTALEHYLCDDERKRRTLKRGWGQTVIALEGTPDTPLADHGGQTPDEVMDAMWKRELLSRAAERMEGACLQAGRELTYSIFREYYLSEAEPADYKAVAAKLAVPPADVSGHLVQARAMYRGILKELVAETVGDSDELKTELKALFGDRLP